MRLLEGLDCTQIRRISWTRGDSAEVIHARTSIALAYKPGREAYEMWAAHTEVIYRQWKAEELTILKDGDAREREIA